jgi:hypothetical protein
MKSALLAIFLVLSGFAWAGSDFEAGTKAFDDGKFIEARQRYEAQVSRGEWTANLFYNLGNTNAQIGAPGLAMLNYERALVLNPTHRDARASLEFLRKQSLARTPEPSWKDQAFGWMNFNGWIIAAAGAGWLAVFIVVVPVARGRRLGAGGAFWLVLVLCLAGVAGFGAWLASGELDAGVIVVKQAEARQGPAERATLADTLPVGSRVRVLTVRGEWTFVELPGGARAWVPSASVEKIRLS